MQIRSIRSMRVQLKAKNMNDNLKSNILRVITPGDKVLILIIIVLGIISLIALSHLRQPGDFVTIEVNGQVVHRLDLNISREVTVKGPIGETIIKISQNSAQVVHSDCPEKICVKTGEIHLAGEMIVCVPNKVVIKINSKQKNQFDVITQ